MTSEDDNYLTKVFSKFDTLGVDAAGEANGRRVLSKFNGENAAREILKKWKGLQGEELDKYIKENFDASWSLYEVDKNGFMDLRNAYYWIRHLAKTEYTV